MRVRRAALCLGAISGLGIAGIALMAAYDDAHTAVGYGDGSMGNGPPRNPMPPPEMMTVFERSAAAHHVPLALLLAVGAQESGYDPAAQSAAGAQGVMQMLPATFAAYAPTGARPSDIWNPNVEIDAAAAMLAADGAAAGDEGRALHAYNQDLTYVAQVEDRAAAYQQWLDDGRPSPDAALPWPLDGSISQAFGCTGVPLEPPRGDCGHFHTGIDIAVPPGTPVAAACPGVVTVADDSSVGFGTHVVVACDAPGVDYSNLYGHLSSRLVGSGDRVAQGQVIGYSGSTGNSTGPHLHFEVDTPDGPADPYRYLARP